MCVMISGVVVDDNVVFYFILWRWWRM